jgi:FkbM family methyltransferase
MSTSLLGTTVARLKSRIATGFIGAVLRKLLLKLGFVLIDKRKFMNLQDISCLLKDNGIEVKTVYDIGAYIGNWSLAAKRIFGPDLITLAFEPNAVHNKRLELVANGIYNLVLSDKPGHIDFYSVGGTGDSVYRENSSVYDNLMPTKIEAVCLDFLVESDSLQSPQLIKIDVQGSEMDVLLGATKTVSQASVVVVECQLLSRNQGGSQISSVLRLMQELEFSPIAISEIHQIGRRIEEIDFVFIKNNLID